MRIRSVIGSTFAIASLVGCSSPPIQRDATGDTGARVASVAQADTRTTGTFGVISQPVRDLTWYSVKFHVPETPRTTSGRSAIGVTLGDGTGWEVTAGATWNAPGHPNTWSVQVCQVGHLTFDYWENCGDSVNVALGDEISVYTYPSSAPAASTVVMNVNGAFAVSRSFPNESFVYVENGGWYWQSLDCTKLSGSSFEMFTGQSMLLGGKPTNVPWNNDSLDRPGGLCNVDAKGFDDFSYVTWRSQERGISRALAG